MRWLRWRAWALPMGVVLLGCGLTVALAPAPAPDNGDPSSYATGRAGTWALFQLAARLGANAERLTGSGFGAALSPGGTLVEVSPTTPFSKLQLRQIRRFLEAGGTLVYALGSRSVDAPVLASLQVTAGRAAPAGVSRELHPLRGSTLLTVQFGSGPSLSPAGPQALPLLGSATRPVALVERVGLGTAVVLNSGAPVSNTDLREQQNAEFAVSALGLVAGRPILFDEIHHGYTLGDGAAALLLGTPLGLVTALCTVLLLTFLLTSGRRLGAPLPPRALVSVRSTTDHLDALAQLYERARDRRAVAARYLQQLRATAGALQLHGPSRELAPASLQSRFEAICKKLELAVGGSDAPGRLMSLAQEADQLEREFQGADPGPEEVQVR